MFNWTNERWIITLSKKNGDPSQKKKKEIFKTKLISEAKNSEVYYKIIKNFSDAELIDVESKSDKNYD